MEESILFISRFSMVNTPIHHNNITEIFFFESGVKHHDPNNGSKVYNVPICLGHLCVQGLR
jgi:hypothetical protein